MSGKKLKLKPMTNKFNEQDKKTILILDDVLQRKSVRRRIETIAKRVVLKLMADSTSDLAWEPVSLDTYKMKLPDMIQSSWVFVVRARADTGAERHPNSHQFMMSYKRSGDLQIRIENNWVSNPLTSVLSDPTENRWISIPPNVWHRAIGFEENWIVVSFHTASVEELIEERPTPEDEKQFRQRYYMK